MDKYAVRFSDVRFCYPGGGEVVRGVSFGVRPGEAVLITGKTGCGKSTLLKMLNGIIPLESSGDFEGRVEVNGVDTRDNTIPRLAQEAGLVFQTPDEQLFCNTVYEEVAFGPENVNVPRREIDRRVEASLEKVGLAGFQHRIGARLSGGQKQRVAIASQLSLEPGILALDEPISQLDPAGACEVIECLRALRDSGITIIIVEHRIPEVLPLVDRIIVMDDGRIKSEFDRCELPRHTGLFRELGLKLPDEIRICEKLNIEISGDWRKSVTDGMKSLSTSGSDIAPSPGTSNVEPAGEIPVMRMENVSFSYGFGGAEDTFGLNGISLDINRGDVLAVMGHNGCGKSSLLSLLAGLIKPGSGRVMLRFGDAIVDVAQIKRRRKYGFAGMVFQNPDLQLFEESLDSEIAFGLKMSVAGRKGIQEKVEELKRLLGLERYGAYPATALSKGQRLRAAVGAILAVSPAVLLLDEPTTGQNIENIKNLIQAVRSSTSVEAVVFSTHDVDTATSFANRIIVMNSGRIVADGPPQKVLCDIELMKESGVIPTAVHEMSLQCGFPRPCLTFREFMEYCGCNDNEDSQI